MPAGLSCLLSIVPSTEYAPKVLVDRLADEDDDVDSGVRVSIAGSTEVYDKGVRLRPDASDKADTGVEMRL